MSGETPSRGSFRGLQGNIRRLTSATSQSYSVLCLWPSEILLTLGTPGLDALWGPFQL